MKFKFKKPKSQLDEMQEQYLQKTGSIGFQIAYFGLLIFILVQLIMDLDFKQVAGEYILFGILSVYTMFASFKKGLWARYFKPGIKNYLLGSLIVGIIIGLFDFILCIRFGTPWTPIIDAIVWAIGTFFFMLLTYFIWGGIFKYRAKKLEESEDK